MCGESRSSAIRREDLAWKVVEQGCQEGGRARHVELIVDRPAAASFLVGEVRYDYAGVDQRRECALNRGNGSADRPGYVRDRLPWLRGQGADEFNAKCSAEGLHGRRHVGAHSARGEVAGHGADSVGIGGEMSHRMASMALVYATSGYLMVP